MTDARLQIAEMGMEHFRRESDYHAQQTRTAADMLKAIAEELHLIPEANPNPPALYGMFSLDAYLAAIRRLSTSATPSTASTDSGSSEPQRPRSPGER